MTVNEFINYFKLGHGKAITLLRDEPDKKQFQKPFMELIKTNWFYYNENYAEQIMHILRMKDNNFANELESLLIEILRDGNGAAYALLESLSGEKAEKLIKELYEESYKLLKDWLESGKPTEGKEYDSIYNKYSSYCEALGRGRDQYFVLPELMKEFADLYLISDKFNSYRVSPLTQIYVMSFKIENRGEWFKQRFDETLKDHPAYELVKDLVFAVDPKPSTKEYKTVEDFYNLGVENFNYFDFSDCDNIKIALSKASPEVFRKLAELTLKESDLHIKSMLLGLFVQQDFFYGVMPEFPLSPEPLIDIVNEHFENPPKADLSTNEDSDLIVYFAICLLSEMKNEKAKEFCLSVFANESMPMMLRQTSITTLEKNYKSNDEKLLRELYSSEHFNNHVSRILCKISENEIKDAPYDILFDAYEKTSHLIKYDTVMGLINIGLITDEMLNQCTYDAEPDVVKVAKKEINKRIMERRNNKDNEFGWNEIKSQDDIDFLLKHSGYFHDSKIFKIKNNPDNSILLQIDLVYWENAFDVAYIGFEMLCQQVEEFNKGDDFLNELFGYFYSAIFKFYENSILWGNDCPPERITNKYGFSDEDIWIKCKNIKWRFAEEFKSEWQVV